RTITPGGPAAEPAADPASGPAEVAGTEPAGAPGPAAGSDRPVALVVDDRLEGVRTLRAEGLDVHRHVGQEDTPVEEVREVLGMDPLVGLSARTPGQFSTAAALRDTSTGEALVDLLGVGPVYDTK